MLLLLLVVLLLLPSPPTARELTSDNLCTTCPNVNNDLLIYCPSFCRNPVDPVAFTDSDPAKSTNDNDEMRTGPSTPLVELATDDDDVDNPEDEDAARLSKTSRNTE